MLVGPSVCRPRRPVRHLNGTCDHDSLEILAAKVQQWAPRPLARWVSDDRSHLLERR